MIFKEPILDLSSIWQPGMDVQNVEKENVRNEELEEDYWKGLDWDLRDAPEGSQPIELEKP